MLFQKCPPNKTHFGKSMFCQPCALSKYRKPMAHLSTQRLFLWSPCHLEICLIVFEKCSGQNVGGRNRVSSICHLHFVKKTHLGRNCQQQLAISTHLRYNIVKETYLGPSPLNMKLSKFLHINTFYAYMTKRSALKEFYKYSCTLEFTLHTFSFKQFHRFQSLYH